MDSPAEVSKNILETLGMATFEGLTLQELQEKLDNEAQGAPLPVQVQIYAHLAWLLEKLLDWDLSDSVIYQNSVVAWCEVLRNRGVSRDTLLEHFRAWRDAQIATDPLGARRINLAGLEIFKALGVPSAPPAPSGEEEPKAVPPQQAEVIKIDSSRDDSDVQFLGWKNPSKWKKRKAKKNRMPGDAPPSFYVCRRCGEKGHYIQFCPTNGDPRFERNPPDHYVCYNCGAKGAHWTNACSTNTSWRLTQMQHKGPQKVPSFSSDGPQTMGSLTEPFCSSPRTEPEPELDVRESHRAPLQPDTPLAPSSPCVDGPFESWDYQGSGSYYRDGGEGRRREDGEVTDRPHAHSRKHRHQAHEPSNDPWAERRQREDGERWNRPYWKRKYEGREEKNRRPTKHPKHGPAKGSLDASPEGSRTGPRSYMADSSKEPRRLSYWDETYNDEDEPASSPPAHKYEPRRHFTKEDYVPFYPEVDGFLGSLGGAELQQPLEAQEPSPEPQMSIEDRTQTLISCGEDDIQCQVEIKVGETIKPLERDPPYSPFVQQLFADRPNVWVNVNVRGVAASYYNAKDAQL